MDYRKINSRLILFSIVLLVGVAISMIGRRVMLEKGFDTGTANLTFLIILGICAIFYLIILATLAHSIVPWVMKKLPRKNKSIAIIIEDTENSLSEKEKIPKLQSLEEIRRNADKLYVEKQTAKINLFLEYSHLTMAQYVTDDELLRLDEYIQCYARKETLPSNTTPIKPQKLINLDMCHFGWNMSHYFGFQKQNVAPWLIQVFWDLRDAKPSDITKKLHDSTKNEYNIPIIEDIPRYLREQKN